MATSATQNGITWTWVEDVPVHYSLTGDACVVAPAGITLTAISPMSTKDPISGRVRHGSMVNPNAGIFVSQGFDSAVSGVTYQPALNIARPGDMDLNVGNPRFVAPGSSIVSTRTKDAGNQRPQLLDAAVLTVLAEEPPTNFFRPAYCGTDKSIPAVEGDIDYSFLPSLAKPVGSNYPADLSGLGSFAKVWIEIETEFNGRNLHPANHQPDYGRDMAGVVEHALMCLCLDYTNAQKRLLAIRLAQYGLDIYGALLTGGLWRANGGHNPGRKGAMLFAGRLLQRADMIAAAGNPGGDRRFQEDQTTFYVSQSDVNRTQDNTPPSSGWNPDNRVLPMRYSQDMLEVPEWGIRHLISPSMDNAYWQAIYRTIALNRCVGIALAMRLMGLRTSWSHAPFFDYMDRCFAVEKFGGGFGATNDIATNVRWMWEAYRGTGDVWGENGQIATIRGMPSGRTVEAGQPTTFNVSAFGIPAPTYQWRKNGVNISGATAASYTIPSCVSGDAGTYDCLVTNEHGTVVTWPALLAVTGTDPGDTTPPVFLAGPTVSAVTDSTAELRATPNESGTLYWQLLAGGASAPTAAAVKAGGGLASGSSPTDASVVEFVQLFGLDPSTSYDLYIVAEDSVPNLQATPTKVSFTTTAAPAPGTGLPVGERRRPGSRIIFR